MKLNEIVIACFLVLISFQVNAQSDYDLCLKSNIILFDLEKDTLYSNRNEYKLELLSDCESHRLMYFAPIKSDTALVCFQKNKNSNPIKKKIYFPPFKGRGSLNSGQYTYRKNDSTLVYSFYTFDLNSDVEGPINNLNDSRIISIEEFEIKTKLNFHIK